MPNISINPIPDLSPNIGVDLYYLIDNAIIGRCIASPNGLISAINNSLLIANDGTLWLKTGVDFANTGWVAVGQAIANQVAQFGSWTVINRQTNTVGNVGGGLDVLHFFNLPANSLRSNDDSLKIHLVWNTAGNINAKQFQVSFGAVTFIDTGSVIINNERLIVDIVITRLTSTSVRQDFRITTNGAFVGQNSDSSVFAVADLAANILSIQTVGASAASVTDDAQEFLFVVELNQKPI